MRALVAALLLLGAGTASARADRVVGIAVIGDQTMATPLTASIRDWLARRGVQAAPMAPDAVGTVTDCFALIDDNCARAAVAKTGTPEAVVLVVHGEASAIVLDAHWVSKEKATITQSASCGACGEPDRTARIDTLMSTLASAAGAVTAPQPAGAAAVRTTAQPAADTGRGIAVGAELGEPTAITVGWFAGKLALTGALGTGTFAGRGPVVHAEARYEVTRLGSTAQLRAGAGGRFYHHGYDPASADEIPDSHYGIRGVLELAIDRGRLQLYAEVAPGVDLKRTSSCTLADGVNSICPHAQHNPFFLDLAVGARWFVH